MKYNREDYINRKIQLYPGDTYHKFGTIMDVDDLGFKILIEKTNDSIGRWREGKTYFISHSSNINFQFI